MNTQGFINFFRDLSFEWNKRLDSRHNDEVTFSYDIKTTVGDLLNGDIDIVRNWKSLQGEDAKFDRKEDISDGFRVKSMTQGKDCEDVFYVNFIENRKEGFLNYSFLEKSILDELYAANEPLEEINKYFSVVKFTKAN